MMAVYSHTLACCLSKHRSSIEAGWSVGRIFLEHANPKDAMYIHGEFMEFSWRCDEHLTLMPRRSHGDLTEVCVLGNICGGRANETGFVASRTYFMGRMNFCMDYQIYLL